MKEIKLFLILIFLFAYANLSAQNKTIWTTTTKVAKSSALTHSYKADKKKRYELNITELRNRLMQAPLKKTLGNNKKNVAIAFPMPDGTLKTFEVYETPVMETALAQQHLDIRSYTGKASGDTSGTIKFTLTDFGFHGMIFSPEGKISYINPEDKENNIYEVFSRKDLQAETFECMAKEVEELVVKNTTENKMAIVNDGNLRTFRLALAATAEYTQFHANAAGVGNGTDEEKRAAALAAMTITMARVNGIFEREVNLTMELVPNESIIFTDPNTDGLTNNSGGTLINEIQSVIDANIGNGSYDIGHVFSTGGGGIAQLNSPCVAGKARGVTGLGSPVGDPFDVDFVSHEMGHQYGATHTYNNSCGGNRTSATAVEPGSGSTIMSYAGICPDNVQSSADDYFHVVSIQQMYENITSGNSTCAALTPTGNTAPTADAGNDYIIPAGTPFVLEGQATDADGDILTYSWEQTDNEIAVQPPQATSAGGPMFRSLLPSVSPNRYLPNLPDLLAGNLSPEWEVLPEVSREMNFALLVRDNNPVGGQTAIDGVLITVDDSSGPFVVTSQLTEESWEAGEVHTVTWDIANTDVAPVGAANISIILYTDAQFENGITLADNVPNDGSHNIIVPGGIDTTTGRLMIRPVDNIFFAVNAADITVTQREYVLNFTSLEHTACQPNDAVIDFTYNNYLGFSDQTDFAAINVPAGLMVNFNPVSAMADDTNVQVTVTGTNNVVEGDYVFIVQATSGGLVQDYEIALTVYDNTFEDVPLISPADTETGTYLDALFQWQATDFTESYDIEISETPDFLSIIESATVTRTSYTPSNLADETQYYWRIKPANSCGEGTFGTAFSFTTTPIDCNTFANNEVMNISSSGPQVVASSITIIDNLSVNSIAVSIDLTHTWAADMRATLTSPSGTVVNLFSNICDDGDNMSVTFVDGGDPVSCSGSPPALSGMIRPEQPLSTFRNEPAQGEWTLTIYDDFNLDGGALNSFSLDVCVNGVFPPDEDGDGVIDDDDDCLGTPMGETVNANGCTIFTLPADNFAVNITGESCIANNDGSITIAATDQTLNYQAALTGPVNSNQDFTDTTNFSNLLAGAYTLCITVVGEPDYEQCYDINVVEPAPLAVQSRINTAARTVTVDMEGGALYNVELNGITTQTTADKLTLQLEEGINTLKVTTDKDCQGIYEERIVVGKHIMVYPNPIATTDLTIAINSIPEEKLIVRIYSVSGKLLHEKEFYEVSSQVQMNISDLPSGTYLFTIEGKNSKATQKIIKL